MIIRFWLKNSISKFMSKILASWIWNLCAKFWIKFGYITCLLTWKRVNSINIKFGKNYN